ncbi:hypothetical protein D3C84_1237890 [compost metagenome]
MTGGAGALICCSRITNPLATLPDKEIDDDYQIETGTGFWPIIERRAAGTVVQRRGDWAGGGG